MREKVRIEVHPSLEEELKRIKAKLERRINRLGVNVTVGNNEASKIAARILNQRANNKMIVQNLHKKRGRARII